MRLPVQGGGQLNCLVKTIHALSQQTCGAKPATSAIPGQQAHKAVPSAVGLCPHSPPPLTCLERLVEALNASPPVSASMFPKSWDFKHFFISHSFWGGLFSFTLG